MATKYQTVRQAADQLGVTIQHVYLLLWNGKLEGHKKANIWLITTRSITARQRQQGEKHGKQQTRTNLS